MLTKLANGTLSVKTSTSVTALEVREAGRDDGGNNVLHKLLAAHGTSTATVIHHSVGQFLLLQ